MPGGLRCPGHRWLGRSKQGAEPPVPGPRPSVELSSGAVGLQSVWSLCAPLPRGSEVTDDSQLYEAFSALPDDSAITIVLLQFAAVAVFPCMQTALGTTKLLPFSAVHLTRPNGRNKEEAKAGRCLGAEDGFEGEGGAGGAFPSYLLLRGYEPSFRISLRWYIWKCSDSWHVPQLAWKIQY